MELIDEDPSLLVLVLDLNHHAWTSLENRKQKQSNKSSEESYSESTSLRFQSSSCTTSSFGLTLNEFVNLLLIFVDSYLLCHRHNQICILGAYDNSTEFIYPPETGMGHKSLATYTERANEEKGEEQQEIATSTYIDDSKISENELLNLNESVIAYEKNPRMKTISDAMGKAFENVGRSYINYHKSEQLNGKEDNPKIIKKNRKEVSSIESKYIVKALSKALCYTQRILRESGAGMERNGLLPRILIAQAGRDHPSTYNEMMNCIFAAKPSNIVIDSLLLSPSESTLLQQASYLTSGIYNQPCGSSSSSLLQYMLMLYLPSTKARDTLCLPHQTIVDFKASCFCCNKKVDMAYICSVCLSIFCKFSDTCSTCGTKAKVKKNRK